MNRHSIAACALALAFLALSGRAVLAQGRGQDRGKDHARDTTTTRESANGANAQGGHTPNDADRAIIQADQDRKRAQGGHSFNDQDRQATRDWYQQNRTRLGAGWRDQDRLSPSQQSRLRTGQRLDPELRAHMHWLPAELSGRYAPAPRGYRYAIIGGNVVMLDDMYHVHDVFSLNFQIGGPEAGGQIGRHDNDPWGGQRHYSFNDRDREITRQWYQRNRRHLGAGWRQRDRLSPAMQGRLRAGQRLDPQLRRQIHWVPVDLSRRYGPAPRGYRYAMIGGNIVMLDDSYRVHDVFSLDLQF
jgi:hypothetical protein